MRFIQLALFSSTFLLRFVAGLAIPELASNPSQLDSRAVASNIEWKVTLQPNTNKILLGQEMAELGVKMISIAGGSTEDTLLVTGSGIQMDKVKTISSVEEISPVNPIRAYGITRRV
jgi:hypothetical protein